MADDEIDTHDKAFFNAAKLPAEPTTWFIAWFDLLGTRVRARDAPRSVAVNIGKLHDAAVRGCLAAQRRVSPVAMGDGAYLVTANWSDMEVCLREAFRLMALCIVDNMGGDQPQYVPLCRAGVARGTVIRGADLLAGWEKTGGGLDVLYKDVAKGVLLGPAAASAYEAEGVAPPMGVALDPSAHGAFGPDLPPDGRWWRWLRREDESLGKHVYRALESNYRWASEHSDEWPYPKERREQHERAWKLYLQEFAPVDAKNAEGPAS